MVTVCPVRRIYLFCEYITNVAYFFNIESWQPLKGKNKKYIFWKKRVQWNSPLLFPKVFPGAEQQDFPDSERGGREPRSHHHPGQCEGHGSGSPWRQALPAPPAGNLWLWQPAGVRAAVLQLSFFSPFLSSLLVLKWGHICLRLLYHWLLDTVASSWRHFAVLFWLLRF